MARAKVKADCRADTRGGTWAGIPKCLIDSASYRDLSLHARAILIEIVARMNGWNNGGIAVSQREIVDALGCHNRKAIAGIAELMEHGLIDVSAEGKWKERQARQYRLTFVSTKGAPATNEYLRWTPNMQQSGGAGVAPDKPIPDATVASGQKSSGATVASRIAETRRKQAVLEIEPDATVEPLIDKPWVGPNCGHEIHDNNEGAAMAPVAGCPTCERCQMPFFPANKAKRFCSERCRRLAERARRYQRAGR